MANRSNVPLPRKRIADDAVDVGVGGAPLQGLEQPAIIGDELGRIAGAATDSAESLLNDGKSGILSEGNSDALAVEVQRLATDPQKRRTLGNQARSASRAFSWDAASASALKAYERTGAVRTRSNAQRAHTGHRTA